MEHIVESQQFDVEWLEETFFPLTTKMKGLAEVGGSSTLHGKRMITLFYEPSTRTRFSFETAMYMLGGTVLSTENAREFSSAVKGETLADTIRVLNRYLPDVIVFRHYEDDSARVAVDASTRACIINAGAGRGQHPTQALLDLYTIRSRLGRLANLSIAMVGDLANGRTVRSLAYLLRKYPGVKFYFVAPDNLKIKEDIKEYLTRHETPFKEVSDLREVAFLVDVIYATRIQKERGGSIDEQEATRFRVDEAILSMMKEDAVIMHPLPRNDELAVEVDSDPRAVYLTDQVSAGLYTRMALLKLLLNP